MAQALSELRDGENRPPFSPPFSIMIAKMFSYFLQVLGIAVLLFAAYRVYGYFDILKAIVISMDSNSLTALMPLIFELIVMFLFARLLFWLSTK